MRYLALACDYDGTLAHHGVVEKKSIDAIKELKTTSNPNSTLRWAGGFSSIDIRKVMRKCAKRERIFIGILGLTQQGFHIIASSNVMNQVRKEFAAERIVADILKQGTAISNFRASKSPCEVVFGKRCIKRGRSESSQAESMIASCVRTAYAEQFGAKGRRTIVKI